MTGIGDESEIKRDAFGPALQVNDGLVRNVTIIQNAGAQLEYCPCCNHEVTVREERFRCPHCGRQPIHLACCDAALGICKACARIYESEELQRQECGRLLLRTTSPFGSQDVFLFAKRTLQVGRARHDQLPSTRGNQPKGVYTPTLNDIVLRRMQRQHAEVQAMPDESRLISRVHGAFRVAMDAGQETLKVVDCGQDGAGSSGGTWLQEQPLPKAAWHALPDRTPVLLGRDLGRNLNGLTLYAQVQRNLANPMLVDAVTFLCTDALKDQHRYVMIVREASIGWGCDLTIPLVDDPAVLWGHIRVRGARYVYCPSEQSPLRPEVSSSMDGTVTLKPGVVLRAGDFAIEAVAVEDTSFYEPGAV